MFEWDGKGPLPELGATGEFPLGKQYPDDQGGLAVALTTDKERRLVRFDFGKEISWLSMPKQDALRLAEVIKERAEALPD